MKKIKLKEQPEFIEVDDFSGHQLYKFMGHTVELYSHRSKLLNHKDEVIETTEVNIEGIYAEGLDDKSPYLVFSTERICWPTLYGHMIRPFTLWDRSKDNDFLDMFCWIQYAIENPVKFKETKHTIKVK